MSRDMYALQKTDSGENPRGAGGVSEATARFAGPFMLNP